MKEKLSKVIVILGLIFILVSFINYGIMIHKINNLNTPFLRELRGTYGDRVTDLEFEKEILPIHIYTIKSNERGFLFSRVLVGAIIVIIGRALKTK